MQRTPRSTCAARWVGVFALFCGVIAACASTRAEPATKVDAEYRAVVRELLAATGALELGVQMADGVVQGMLSGMQAPGSTIEPEAAEIVSETAHEFFDDLFGNEDEIVRVQSDIYAKHFTQSELEELLAFYRTPLGAKTIQAMPAILNEGMAYGQSKARAKMGEFQAELQKRLQAAGF